MGNSLKVILLSTSKKDVKHIYKLLNSNSTQSLFIFSSKLFVCFLLLRFIKISEKSNVCVYKNMYSCVFIVLRKCIYTVSKKKGMKKLLCFYYIFFVEYF